MLVYDITNANIFVGVLIYVSEPLGNIIEALGIGDVIHQHNTHGTPVVRGSDCVEPLLASSVPYLKLDLLSSQLYGLDLEVDPNCRDESCVEGVLRKSEEDTW